MFTISNVNHYPQYFKDSTLNTNKNFDYGAFLDLGDQMKLKIAAGNTRATIFAHTFNEKGTYVFRDNASPDKLLMIRVIDLGETCPDPDKYVAQISASTVSQQGVPQDPEIIVRLDVAMIARLFLGMLGCMLIALFIIA